MRVVSDTSPISNLAIIDRLHLLRRQFQELWIPDAVEAELRNLPDSSALAKIGLARREGWIRLRTVHFFIVLWAGNLDLAEKGQHRHECLCYSFANC
jgi:predicted nucleic acid-binding protein